MSSAKELIKQGAVDVNGKVVIDGSVKIQSGDEIKVGERTFLKAK
jgi:ribosomal protein S4